MKQTDPFQEFWETYPLDLCTRRGSKAKAKAAYDKIDSAMYSKILTNLRELIRSDRDLKRRGEFVARYPHVVTWLNGERWEDIQDVQEYTTRPTIQHKDCREDGCSANVDHASGYCWTHYGVHYPDKSIVTIADLKNQLHNVEGIKPDGDRADYIKRCKTRATPRYAASLQRGCVG